MSCAIVVLTGIGIIALSGIPASFGPLGSKTGQWLTTALLAAGCITGLTGAALSLAGTGIPSLLLKWSIPWALPWGHFYVSIDKLSAFFLLPVFIVPMLGSVYGLGYWRQSEHQENGRRLGVFFGLLTASMAMVVIARDGLLFLIVWEIMALSAYFTASVEDDKTEVCRAGWIYLVATHTGTLVLLAMFAIWHKTTGSFSLNPAFAVSSETAGLIFVLSLIGFGFKAGIMPLHVWLPGAHANAPSHVSAVMSGVMLKMGIYGILRITSLFKTCEPWWGIVLLLAGSTSALFGIAFAMGQRDLKKVLAYSSIENIGIITMGIGIALLGKSSRNQAMTLLGLGGALFHVLNHGIFKSLMFLNAGAVIHAANTRDIEVLGGLSKKMPHTSALFALGAVAISALPPLNGFAGEWLIYMGMFNPLMDSSASLLPLSALSAVALSVTGALAILVFVRLYSSIFLGSPRSNAVNHAHDPQFTMKLPMIILALLCVFIGAYPAVAAPLLDGAVRAWIPEMMFSGTIPELVPQMWITWMNAVLYTLLGLAVLWYIIFVRKKSAPGLLPTWDCGYGKPSARMQYTGTSFSQFAVSIFSFAIFPASDKIKIKKSFPETVKFEIAVPDTVLDKIILPIFAKANKILPRVFIFQQGQTYLYVLYVVIITLLLFFLGISGVI